MKPVNFYRTLAVIYAGVVFALSLMPDTGGPGYGWDKAHHFIAYALMAFFFMRAVNPLRPFAFTALGVFVAVLSFGIAVELFQSLTPTRQADAFDVLANAIGALVGIAVFKLLKNRAGVKRC